MSALIKPNALGEPGKGFHRHIGGVAMFDVLATVGGGYLIAKKMRWSVPVTIFSLFLLGEFLHWYFGVPTTVMKALGLVPAPEESPREQ